MIRIYLAGSLLRAAELQAIAARLRSEDYEVTSSWHAVVGPNACDPRDTEERRRVLWQNLKELRDADVVVAILPDVAGKEVYVELGRALERGTPVVMVTAPIAEPLSSADPSAELVFMGSHYVEDLIAVLGRLRSEAA